jgi:hypothetical protein
MQMFIRAFFSYMWTFDLRRTKENKKLMYVVLQGEHEESAVVEVRPVSPSWGALLCTGWCAGSRVQRHDTAVVACSSGSQPRLSGACGSHSVRVVATRRTVSLRLGDGRVSVGVALP